MPYASRSGRARTSSSKPRAFAVCDRCGIWYNLINLGWQFEWRGVALQNSRILVCPRCTDKPQEQNRAFSPPADPLPVMNARVEQFRTASRGSATGQVVGWPTGMSRLAIMPWVKGKPYGVPIPLLSVTADGSTTIWVTCAQPHGLGQDVSDNQIAIDGLSDPTACGMFTVVTNGAIVFSYDCAQPVAAASLLTPTTICVTAQAGLPYDTPFIPQVAP